MAKKTISFRYDGEKVEYRYSISKFRNVRHISIERDCIFGLQKEWDMSKTLNMLTQTKKRLRCQLGTQQKSAFQQEETHRIGAFPFYT